MKNLGFGTVTLIRSNPVVYSIFRGGPGMLILGSFGTFQGVKVILDSITGFLFGVDIWK